MMVERTEEGNYVSGSTKGYQSDHRSSELKGLRIVK